VDKEGWEKIRRLPRLNKRKIGFNWAPRGGIYASLRQAGQAKKQRTQRVQRHRLFNKGCGYLEDEGGVVG
jgi:hypothetical protein